MWAGGRGRDSSYCFVFPTLDKVSENKILLKACSEWKPRLVLLSGRSAGQIRTNLSWLIVWAYSLHETADGRSLQAASMASSSTSLLSARRGLPVQFQLDFAFNLRVRKAHFTSQLIYMPACDFPVPFLKHFPLNRFTQLTSSQLWSLQDKANFEGFMLIYHFLSTRRGDCSNI